MQEGTLLRYFGQEAKRVKKSELFKNEPSSSKGLKIMKIVESGDSGDSGSSSRMRLLGLKPQKNKLTDMWNVPKEVKERVAKAEDFSLDIKIKPDKKDIEIMKLREKNSEIRKYLEMKKREIENNSMKIEKIKQSYEVNWGLRC